MIYKAVVFDFFGVFAPDVYPEWLQKHIRDVNILESHYLALAQKMDEGRISKEDFFEKLAKDSKQSPRTVENQLNDFNLRPPVVKLLQEISDNYKTALVCNASSVILDPILNKQGLKEYFDLVVYSSDVGFAKPDPRIYHVALNQLNVLPGETVFIDDRESNINAALQQGISSILYKDLAALRESLANYGIVKHT